MYFSATVLNRLYKDLLVLGSCLLIGLAINHSHAAPVCSDENMQNVLERSETLREQLAPMQKSELGKAEHTINIEKNNELRVKSQINKDKNCYTCSYSLDSTDSISSIDLPSSSIEQYMALEVLYGKDRWSISIKGFQNSLLEPRDLLREQLLHLNDEKNFL